MSENSIPSYTKKCPKCGQIKPLTCEFWYKNKARDDGFQGYCKICRNIISGEHRVTERGRESNRIAAERYRNKHPDRVKTSYTKWSESTKGRKTRQDWRNRPDVWEKCRRARVEKRRNPITGDIERSKELIRVHKPENQKRRKAYAQQYRSRQNVKERQHDRYIVSKQNAVFNQRRRVNHQRYKARKLNLPLDFTSRDWAVCLEYWSFSCAICGRPRGFWHTLAQDHWIPINSDLCPGTLKTNIVPLCHGIGGCNNSKNDTPADIWLVERYGKRKSKQILKRVESYFEWIKQQE